MIKIIFLIIVIGIVFVFWKLNNRHNKTYTKVYIDRSFDSLKVGKTAIFKASETINPGDYVLIKLPGYDMIWKVSSVWGDKLDLYSKYDKLLEFPKYHIKGKLIGYEEEMV